MSLSFHAYAPLPRSEVKIGKMRLEALDLASTARFFADYCLGEKRAYSRRPLYSTSANGHVISLCARDSEIERSFLTADSISADGQPMVTLSRLLSTSPLPERVATTDLYPEVARLAEQKGLTFYLLGATESVNRKAFEATRQAFPRLRIVGRRNGYFDQDQEDQICAEIAALKPDILWVSLGVPLEQAFCARNLHKLSGVGIVKTAGGLFDFVSREKSRAPRLMQRLGFEWLYRLMLEPRRLFVRYVTTNPHAVLVMLKSMR